MIQKMKKKIRQFLGMISVQDLKSSVYTFKREISHIKGILNQEGKQASPKKKQVNEAA
jgi:hypothetical protein